MAWIDDTGRLDRLEALKKMGQEARKAQGEAKSTLEMKRRELQREVQKEQQKHLLEMRHHWVNRMATTTHPLQEKLTLFWHGHFATSIQKVKDAYSMWRQNEVFRKHAAGNWRHMLLAVSRDPAMLIWLDQNQSRKQHPNENFARELMELFTLGEGNYTEQDVTEAARALTGWTYSRTRDQFEYRSLMHDQGSKTVLGRTGMLNGGDVVEAILTKPQAAKFICQKLWLFFVDEEPESVVVENLAGQFRRSNFELRPVLSSIFSCQKFYDPSVMGKQIKSPAQWLVGSVKMLEIPLPQPASVSTMLKSLGQELFMPPNVKGWDGGLSWINTNTMVHRMNFVATLVHGSINPEGQEMTKRRDARRQDRETRRSKPAPVAGWARSEKSIDGLIASFEKRFLAVPLRQEQKATLKQTWGGKSIPDEKQLRGIVQFLLAAPQYQLC